MIRKDVVDWLRSKISPAYWTTIWMIIPFSAIFLLPVGAVFFFLLARLGIEEAPRWTQLLMLFFIIYGLMVGVVVLLLVDFTEISKQSIFKIKWVARIAVVSPILELLVLFLIFSRP